MKHVLLLLAALSLIVLTTNGQSHNPMEAAKNWSLFFEYHKNGDHKSAVPYGWRVIQLDPDRFKTVYGKLAESYLTFYQDTTHSDSLRAAYADTMIMIYDIGIKNVPDRAAGLWLSRGYSLATYFPEKWLEAIESYEKALALDPKTDFVYADQLGALYIKYMDKNPEFRLRAIDLYRREKEKNPDNTIISERLRQVVSDPMELVRIAENDLKNDPENTERIWEAARAHKEAEQYNDAERHLLKLVAKEPTAANYWNELGVVRQRGGKYKGAIEAYEKALKLNPALRENHLNIAACYRAMKNYQAAITTALKAAQREKGWGRPYFEIAEVYKASVENCIRDTKGGDWSKLDFDDKLVYRLAQMAYDRGRDVEPSLSNEASQRINELSTLVPTKEDYFFNDKRKTGGKFPVHGDCYKWVTEQVPAPNN